MHIGNCFECERTRLRASSSARTVKQNEPKIHNNQGNTITTHNQQLNQEDLITKRNQTQLTTVESNDRNHENKPTRRKRNNENILTNIQTPPRTMLWLPNVAQSPFVIIRFMSSNHF